MWTSEERNAPDERIEQADESDSHQLISGCASSIRSKISRLPVIAAVSSSVGPVHGSNKVATNVSKDRKRALVVLLIEIPF